MIIDRRAQHAKHDVSGSNENDIEVIGPADMTYSAQKSVLQEAVELG